MRRLLFINFSKTSSHAFLLFLVSVADVPTMFRECLNSILSYSRHVTLAPDTSSRLFRDN